jgi:Leucine-rich repeat (LRR) protein
MNQEELILYLSLPYLDDNTLIQACQVNTRFYQRVCNQIWFNKLQQNYSDIIITFPDTVKAMSYKDQYLLLSDLNTLKRTLIDFDIVKWKDSLLNIYELKRLDLSELGLNELPKEIGQLKNLELLFAYDNRLKSLPKEIGQLKNLKELYLSYNQLTDLPKEIGELKKLEYLNVSRNQLKTLPREIGNLNKLKIFFARNNHLTKSELPQEIKNLHIITIDII